MYKLFAYAALALVTLSVSVQAAVEHQVRRGETLAEIAKAYKVTVQAIKEANQLTNANRIAIGQKLSIPGVGPAKGATHIVRKGDTLAEIAKNYGVALETIKSANRLTNANRLAIGQELIIPGATRSLSPSPSSSTPSGQSTTHTVRRNETLTEIAQAYKVSVEAIKSANQITNANRISVGQKLKIPAATAQYVEYKIRRGDSLSDIAKDYGVTVKSITSANNIRNASRIRVGQVIRIPTTSGIAPKVVNRTRYPQLSNSLQKSLERISVRKNQWRHIVIHHSATKRGSVSILDRYHRVERRMQNGLAYHFVIGNGLKVKDGSQLEDGEIAIGDRWKKQIQGGHLSSYTLNQISIGICLIGDFTKHKPTAKQMASLEALTRYLLEKAGVPVERVTTHTLIHPKHTLCPGKYFPTTSFKETLKR